LPPRGNDPRADIDGDTAMIFALSGFTIGSATLSRSTRRVPAGGYVVATDAGLHDGQYHVYRAWEADAEPAGGWSAVLERLLRRLFERLAASLGGRTVLVPLSAGLDSRLIASGLRAVGYDNVKCFAYGQRGNFEAVASQQIAERLGYPWTFVAYTQTGQRAAFAKPSHEDYRRFSDSLTATPFEQDFPAFAALLDGGWAPRDAVVVNGQSGDFITGNHIPPSLGPEAGDGAGRDRAAVLDALIAKHYGLWRALGTPERLALVRQALSAELDALGAPRRPGAMAYGVYECSEYQNRQAKYVLGGQRVYDYLGLDWRLPLWERPFVDFWRTVPLALKYRQRLYRETLLRLDWGDVWHGIDDRRRISPGWLVPLRRSARLALAPFGRARWHEVERRYFAYWMDLVCNYAAQPYGRVARDRRGFRNAIAWFTEAYLARHGLDWTGAPLPS
jgi:asparagine synthase (glutamine-hydrolysing)